MYIPEQFKLTEAGIIENFIRQNGFATVISAAGEFPYITHIPLELELNEAGEKVLSGHMAKANPHWRAFASQSNITAVFLSDINHYISSSWYNHPNAPTWNYISVHVSGTVKILDEEKTWDSVKRLTDRYENEVRSKCPVSLDLLPKAVQNEINGLVAFEIKIEKTEAAFKLSQNRDDENDELVLKELEAQGNNKAATLAQIMRKMRPGKALL